MQLQDGPRAYLAGYQMDHGHHGADAPLPAGGIEPDAVDDEHPAPPTGAVMSSETVGLAEVKAKVMTPPDGEPVKGVDGAEVE